LYYLAANAHNTVLKYGLYFIKQNQIKGRAVERWH